MYGVAGIRRIVTLAAALATFAPAPAAAQAPPGVDLFAGIERVEYRYRFHDESTLDTPFPVPHFFEQRYERTAPIFGVRGRYAFKATPMTTALSVVLERKAFGSDTDTFLQPGGQRVTIGASGDVDLASIRIEHVATLFTLDTFHAGVAFAWRRDRAEARDSITGRESAVSQTFEFGVEGTVMTLVGSSENWLLEARARLSPVVHARLAARDTIFTAIAWSGSGTISMTREFGRIGAGVWAGIEQAGEYRDTARFGRTAATAGVSIAFGSRR